MEGKAMYHFFVSGRQETTSEAPDMPAELLRLRILDQDDKETDEGVLVWISERLKR